MPPPIPEFLSNPPASLLRRLGWGALAWLVGGYVWDDWVWPELVASIARAKAHERGLPLLSVGVGTPGSSFRAAVLGPGPMGDVNVDLEATDPRFVRADIAQLPFESKRFGACVAAHVLEHVNDPGACLRELERVTDGPVYAITPAWWYGHAWLHPGHRWLRLADGSWRPLWQ